MRKNRNRLAHLALIFGLTIALLGAGPLLPNQPLFAAEQTQRELPRVDGETRLYPGYPYQFDGIGIIDRIGEEELVVSDELLILPIDADLHTPRSSSASKSSFGEGDYVGYQLDESGAIQSLWLLQKGNR